MARRAEKGNANAWKRRKQKVYKTLTRGSFTCTCRNGWEGDGTSCVSSTTTTTNTGTSISTTSASGTSTSSGTWTSSSSSPTATSLTTSSVSKSSTLTSTSTNSATSHTSSSVSSSLSSSTSSTASTMSASTTSTVTSSTFTSTSTSSTFTSSSSTSSLSSRSSTSYSETITSTSSTSSSSSSSHSVTRTTTSSSSTLTHSTSTMSSTSTSTRTSTMSSTSTSTSTSTMSSTSTSTSWTHSSSSLSLSSIPTSFHSATSTSGSTTITLTYSSSTASISSSSSSTGTTTTTTTRTLWTGSAAVTEAALGAAAASANAEASAAVAATEAALGAAAASVLADVNENELKTKAVLKPVTSETGENITVAVMTAEGAAANGGKLKLAMGTTAVEMPASVLRALASGDGPVAMAATVMGGRATASLMRAAGDGASGLAGAPVALSMFDSAGNPLPVEHLDEPLVIKVSDNADPGARCMFWNASLGDWSEVGLKKQDGNGSELLCSTTHLSIFAGIAIQVLKTISCSNAAALFSNDALKHISQGGWSSSGPSVVMWSTLTIILMFLLGAVVLDRRDSRRYRRMQRTEHRSGVRKIPAKEEDSATKEKADISWRRKCSDMVLEVIMAIVDGILANMRFMVRSLYKAPHAPRMLVEKAVGRAQSFQVGVHPESIALMRQFGDEESLEDEAKDIIARHKTFLLSKEYEEKEDVRARGDAAMHAFLERSICYRFACLFAAQNPLTIVMSFSLTDSHLARAWLLTIRLVGATAANALFYDMGALPRGMAEHLHDSCSEEDEYGWIGNFVVGMCTTILSDGAMVLLVAIRGKQCPELRALINGQLDLDNMERLARKAQVRGRAFWCIVLGYSAVCFYVCIAFNASVSEKDQGEWLLACLFSLMELLLFEVAMSALLLTSFVTFALWYHPEIGSSVRISRRFSSVIVSVRRTLFGVAPSQQRVSMGVVPSAWAQEEADPRQKFSALWSLPEDCRSVEVVSSEPESASRPPSGASSIEIRRVTVKPQLSPEEMEAQHSDDRSLESVDL
eukprot:TRINITY_DN18919_c0_g1_i2.p1 TRINITY_DN18919_c0_g1~~TRINITY_DN18919_c0_g1_i2.p1  ORF type:complete len:1033 (-),score=146.35 TRINITY_DN18919_c0_g1_i2:94-3192(-)